MPTELSYDGYWIMPDGDLVDVADSSHSTAVYRLTGQPEYETAMDRGYVRISFFGSGGVVQYTDGATVAALKAAVTLLRNPSWNRGSRWAELENRSLGYPEGYQRDLDRTQAASILMRLVLEKNAAAKSGTIPEAAVIAAQAAPEPAYA